VHQGEVTTAQRQQLLFYCVLILRAVGELPVEAAVRDADGKHWPIEFDADDAAAEERRAEEALAALRGADGSSLEARPSELNCGTCPFRPVCGPFLAAFDPSWRVGRVCAGRIVGEEGEREENRTIDVDVEWPEWAAGPLRLVGVPVLRDPLIGERWGFSDFEGHGGSGLARWNTVAARW
jgi:hypothetical protein